MGNVHVWDRDTATLLHLIHAPDSIGQVTSLAWNTSLHSLMFATGSLDGAVRIWTVVQQEPKSPESISARYTPSTPGPEHSYPGALPASSFRRRRSSFGVGYRSESPTMEPTEDLDSSLFLDDSAPIALPRSIRRATTTS